MGSTVQAGNVPSSPLCVTLLLQSWCSTTHPVQKPPKHRGTAGCCQRYLFLTTHFRDKICNTGEVKADVSATGSSHLAQGISQRVGPSSAKQGSISTTAWQQSLTGQHVWHEEPAALPLLTCSPPQRKLLPQNVPVKTESLSPKNLNWGSQLELHPAEHGFERCFKLHHLRTDKWAKPFGLKALKQLQC